MSLSKQLGSNFIDAACFATLFGIYPRFIEPKMLFITRKEIHLPRAELAGLKIIQISDLHFHEKTSLRFLKKIEKVIEKERADLIFFTGDFLCYSRMEKKNELKSFLNTLKAKVGSFCIFGNHDYERYVSRNSEGDYTQLQPIHPLEGALKGFRTIFSRKNLSNKIDANVFSIEEHRELISLLQETPFTLLENKTQVLDIGLNVVGLGDYALGRFNPKNAFQGYRKEFPGIVLSHNPDTFLKLLDYPGELILSGHSHGGQIHFPFPQFLKKVSEKLTRLEHPEFARGFHTRNGKSLYVNRGLGCHKPIRLFSPPEITIFNVRPHG